MRCDLRWKWLIFTNIPYHIPIYYSVMVPAVLGIPSHWAYLLSKWDSQETTTWTAVAVGIIKLLFFRIFKFVNLHCINSKFCARAYLGRLICFCLRWNLEFPRWGSVSKCFTVIIFVKHKNKKGAFFLLSFIPICLYIRVRYLLLHPNSSWDKQ